MVKYACFICGRKISEDLLGKRIRCPYCSSKMLYKPRTTTTKVKAV
ncbi:DNA-directed RNA polymerase subunit P [Candidatus Woesearchaeota archaeon]|nr:DNA-directed RNA polymerase subunit P [Candidatus Woesearchaeota archaeon]